MDNFYIDYKKGIQLGNEMKIDADELKKLLARYSYIHEKLKSVSNIENNYEYSKQLSVQMQVMNKLSDLVTETSNLLINISSAYIDVENVSNNKEEL